MATTLGAPNKTMYADDYLEWVDSRAEEIESSVDAASLFREGSQ
jgi:hypothetical protein